MTPMFPLGSVLFPHMPLPLRVFEPRYLRMLGDLLEDAAPEFGVVLIERGHEVGGGDQRFDVGTLARIVQIDAREGYVGLVAQGTRRFTVERWLADEPYPQAELAEVPDFSWDDGLQAQRDEAEREVRRALAAAAEFGASWPMDVTLPDDPVAACWQLAAITPVGALDQVALLRAPDLARLIAGITAAAQEAQESLRLGWPGA